MKKFLTTIFIVMLAAVLIVAPMSGCNKCDHDVTSWEIDSEPTCTTPGLKHGVCGNCYETIYEEIPVDPDAHVYGEWEVAAPTLTKQGVAVKTCSECGYRLTEYLPTLDNTSYTSQITTRPSASTTGISLYTYPSEYGDITFEVEIGSEGVQTVTDAVSVGSMSESHDMIRSATGTRGDKRIDSGDITSSVLADIEASAKSFSYEMYDGYTHLNADDGSEYWMGLDDGEIYGYFTDENGTFAIASNSNYFYGFRYYLTYTDTLSYYYGTENFLSGLYSYAKKNVNGDFKESVNSDGSYSFSFGTYTIYSSGTNGALFSQIEVTFTLTESYTIDTLNYYSVTYANDSETYDSSTGSWSSDAAFDFDENGNAYVKEANGLKFVETYTVTQTERKSSDEIKTMPYTADTRFYTDFDVTYGGKVISDGGSIELVAGTTTGYDFSITNLTPSDAIGDTITFYYKQPVSGGDYTYTEIDINTESSVGIFVHLNSSNNFCIKSNIADTITIAVCSHNVTKEITITFTSTAPTALYPTVYDYGATGYVENTDYKSTSNSATVYVGQPLYYKTSLIEAEAGKCTESYETTVTYTGSSDDYLVNDSTSVYIDSSSEYVPASSFTAYKAGTYVLTLTSTEDGSVTCTITVTVEEAPSLDSIFTGTKTGTFSMTEDPVTVTFGDITKESVTYTDDSGNTVEAYKCTVTATVVYNSSTRVLCTYYTSRDGTIVYNISYTQVYNAEDMVTSEMIDEALSDEYYFTISLNEAFCITVTHTLGSDFEYANETAVLR